MASEDSESFGNVATWRILLLFVLITVIDATWEYTHEKIQGKLREKKRKGLKHAWEQLKFEIMSLGLVSLLLVVFEEYLLKICINSKDSASTKESSQDKAYSSGPENGELDGNMQRRLLAASFGDTCPDGQEPLWPSALMHKLHILIFLIAVSHVLYALCSLALCLWSIRRWRRFENQAKNGLQPLSLGQLKRQGESRVWFGLRQCWRQFTNPIDCATYLALRRMFIERMQVDDSFDFANFVTNFMEEEFAEVVRLEFLMWIVAMVWVLFPDGSYVAFWMTATFLTLSVIAGAKLHVVAMQLASSAYTAYKNELTPAQRTRKRPLLGRLSAAPRRADPLRPMLKRISQGLALRSRDDASPAECAPKIAPL